MLLRILPLTALCLCLFAQSRDNPGVPKLADKQPVTGSGEYLFRSHCASCHGLNAKGAGPAAGALRMKPADLTQLARRSDGKFPAYRVEKMLGSPQGLPAHGTRQMPVWGPGLQEIKPNGPQAARRVQNLLAYLESIQEK